MSSSQPVPAGAVSAYIELEIHGEEGSVAKKDLIAGHTYSARVFVRQVREGSIYLGKTLAISIYSPESLFNLNSERQVELVVQKSQKMRESTYANFEFSIKKAGTLILYIDVFLGWKLITRMTTVKKVTSE